MMDGESLLLAAFEATISGFAGIGKRRRTLSGSTRAIDSHFDFERRGIVDGDDSIRVAVCQRHRLRCVEAN